MTGRRPWHVVSSSGDVTYEDARKARRAFLRAASSGERALLTDDDGNIIAKPHHVAAVVSISAGWEFTKALSA